MSPSGKVPGAEKGLVQGRRGGHSHSHFSGHAKTAPRDSCLSSKPQLKCLSSVKLSKTPKLNELPGLHRMVFSPTLCFPRILSIPLPIKGSWRATYLHQALRIQSCTKYSPCLLSKGEQTSKQSTEAMYRAAEGRTRYPETQELGPTHFP